MKLENGQWVAYNAEDETETVQLLRAGYNITCDLYPSTFTGYELDENNIQIKSIELEVMADQSLDASVKASDHLYAFNQDKNMEVKAIELKLEHQMSKLSLELTLGSQYEEEQNPVKDMQIVGTKRKVNGQMDIRMLVMTLLQSQLYHILRVTPSLRMIPQKRKFVMR